MTKFEKLCKDYSTARKKYFDYRISCLHFVPKFVDGMINYLQCPEEQVNYYPFEGDREPNTVYTFAGEMRLCDDSFWHIKIGLTLHGAANIFPKEELVFPVLIKKINDYFIVKLGRNGKEYKIHKDQPGELKDFYDLIFLKIKEFYKKEIQQFYEHEDTSKKIGFDV